MGVGGEYTPRGWSLTAALAISRWDGVVGEATTGDSAVVRLDREGIHETDLQRSREGVLGERLAYLRIGRDLFDGLALGVAFSGSGFSRAVVLGEPEPVESRILGGADLAYEKKGFAGQAECVVDPRGPFGAVAGGRYDVGKARISAALWRYGRDFVPLHGRSFSFRDESSDERGALVGLRVSLSTACAAEWFSARYSQD